MLRNKATGMTVEFKRCGYDWTMTASGDGVVTTVGMSEERMNEHKATLKRMGFKEE